MDVEDRLRTKAGARHIGVSARTLASRAWRQRHGIPTYRVGRLLLFDRMELDAWLARHREAHS